MSNEVFCSAPWSSMYVDTRGKVKPCCVSFEQLGDISQENGLLEAYNSPQYVEIRRQMVAGEKPRSCRICYKKESLGFRSRRASYPKIYLTEGKELTKEGDPDLVTSLDLTFSNICNLRCRFCGPFCSSKWIEDSKLLPDNNQLLWGGHKEFNWKVFQVPAEDMMRQIQNFRNLDYIEVNGGEPFMAAEHLKFLKLMVDSGRSKDVTMIYTTNGTIFPDKYVPYLSEFKDVKVSISTEGVGDVYRYSRGFDGAEDFLEKVVQCFKKVPSIRLAFNYTIFALNIFGVENFWEWYKEMNEKYSMDIHLGVVVAPSALQIQNLPRWFRLEALEKIPQEDHPVLEKIRSVLVDETNDSLSDFSQDERLDLFWEHVNTLDKIQKTSLVEKQPIYSKIFIQNQASVSV